MILTNANVIAYALTNRRGTTGELIEKRLGVARGFLLSTGDPSFIDSTLPARVPQAP
jgi:hypothetical protein